MKPEWGTRRVCHACQTAFYDMCKKTMTCPKCQKNYVEKDFCTKPSLSLNNEVTDEITLNPIVITPENPIGFMPQNDDSSDQETDMGELAYQSDILLTRKVSNNIEG